MGGVGGDINAVEIVEKGDGVVVDDFIVDLPPDQLPETIVTACQRLTGVRVEWISRYPEGGGLQSDLEALERMTADPAHAAETLVSLCPVVFRSHWAVLLEVTGDGPSQPSPPPWRRISTPDAAAGWLRSTPPTGSNSLRLAARLGRHDGGRRARSPGPGDRHRPARRAGVPRLRDRPAAPPGRPGQVADRPRIRSAHAARRLAEALALLTSIGFGVLSAIVPVVNAEAYVSPPRSPRSPARCRWRSGWRSVRPSASAAVPRRPPRPRVPVRPRAPGHGPARASVGPTPRLAWHDALQLLLRLVGTKRWGLPITLLAAVVGLPPLYAVALLAGATKMRALLVRPDRAGRPGHPVRAGRVRSRGAAVLAVVGRTAAASSPQHGCPPRATGECQSD